MPKKKTSGDGGGPKAWRLLVGYTGAHLDAFHLDLECLTRGLVVVGQSGCGKSYFLARLLEEMLINGRPEDHFLIIDSNSDFRHGLRVARKVDFNRRLKDLARRAVSPDCDHVKGNTKRKITGVLPAEVKSRSNVDDDDACRKAKVFGPTGCGFALDWQGLLTDDSHNALLRCLPTWREDRVEYRWGLSWALANLKGGASPGVSCRTLQSFCRAFWQEIAVPHRLSKAKILDAGTEHGLGVDLRELGESSEWRTEASESGLPKALLNQRVSILETEMLEGDAARMRVVLHTLEFIWQQQLKARDEALKTEGDTEGRRAYFIIIEEAHRFAPEKPGNPLIERVSETIQRIAAEGRKYGIYLMLATQRPTKVARGLLGECDNAIIMKMNSRADLEFLSDEMRILDVKLLEATLHFRGKGNALALGEAAGAAPNVVQFATAPRRTAEGGGDLVR